MTSYGGVLEYMFTYSVNVTADDIDDEEAGYLGNYDVIIEVIPLGTVFCLHIK